MHSLIICAAVGILISQETSPSATGDATAATTHTANEPTELSGVEVPGEKPRIKVSRREIAIARKQLKSRGDVVICKRAQVTGTRFPGPPVCKTNRDWDRNETEKRRNLERILSNRTIGGCRPPKC